MQAEPSQAFHLLMQILAQLPLLFAATVGLVLSLAWRRRAPKAMLLAAAGCTLLLLTVLVARIWYHLVMPRIIEGIGFEAWSVFAAVMTGFFNLLHALSVGLILAGVYVERRRASEPPSRAVAERATVSNRRADGLTGNEIEEP